MSDPADTIRRALDRNLTSADWLTATAALDAYEAERDALENALREIEGAKCSAGRFSSRWWAHALNLQRIARAALAATDTTREPMFPSPPSPLDAFLGVPPAGERQEERCGALGHFSVGPITCQLPVGHTGDHEAWQYADTRTGDRHAWPPAGERQET